MSAENQKKYPGFIDIHVHLRDPGDTHREDFLTGSRAAAKGGMTVVADMPNNQQPITTLERLDEKISLAKAKSIVDVYFHYGTNGENTDTFIEATARPEVLGLKLYCNHTTGEMLIEDSNKLEKVFREWESEKPILVHAEGKQLETVIGLASSYDRRLHVCHISLEEEVELVREAKSSGQKITAGVCPHHLFLINDDEKDLGSLAMMKPPLGTKQDLESLWEGLIDGTIDLVESDHAPHTLDEKESDKPPFGVPGLETMFSLVLKGIRERGLSEDLLELWFYRNPKEIFDIPEQENTYVMVDLDETWVVGEYGYETKCDWSPFEGLELPGVISLVVIHGLTVVEDGQVV